MPNLNRRRRPYPLEALTKALYEIETIAGTCNRPDGGRMHHLGRLTRIILKTASLIVLLFMLCATAEAHIAASAGSISFPDQTIGTASAAVSVTLTNTSDRPTTIVSVSTSLSIFVVFGPSLPMTLAPSQSVAVTVIFMPLAPQAYADTLVVARDYGSPAYVTLNGMGTVPPLPLNSSAGALTFGNVGMSTSASQSVALTNAGASDIAISNVVVVGAGFTTSGVSAGLIVPAGQSVTLSVTFKPSAIGPVTGSIAVISNATNSPSVIGVSATGIHSVLLSWTPSTSVVIGYNSYSSTVSGGPYQKLNASPLAATSYTDSSVNSGSTYYYVFTAVDANNQESAYSQEVFAAIP